MRYLNPVSNPLAHYWEEEISGFWGSWPRFRKRSGRFISWLLGEVVLANLYMLSELILGHRVWVGLQVNTQALSSRFNMGAFAKRILDIFGASVGLVISLPLWILVPLAIKLDSKGTVLYSQTRVGRDRRKSHRRSVRVSVTDKREIPDRRQRSSYGKPFQILKFRTMCRNAETKTGPVWASPEDPRVTRVGRILRKTRLDEIPQLLNVLKGDMSLVGPRPERLFFIEKLEGKVENYRQRFAVKPGITGLAQVEHQYDQSLDDVNNKIKYDLRYIRNWKLLEDFRILLKTVIVVITARGI